MQTKRKALALLSGGLDSILAAKLIMLQGVLVEGVYFVIGFSDGQKSAEEAAATLGINLHVVDVIDEFKKIMADPKYGFGANLNPCLDCKILMVKMACAWAQENGFDFVVTGEVVGQRPKSQRTDTMSVVIRESGANERVLRPLSAKILSPTLPEKEGWVEREQLYDISGRSRARQIALARELGISNYPQPAGGCWLTEVKFCDRLRDLWSARGSKDYSRDDLQLLRLGRHLRPRKEFKMTIGRDEKDNELLEKFTSGRLTLRPISHPGPLVIVEGKVEEIDFEFIAAIAARFSQGRNAKTVTYSIERPNAEKLVVTIKPFATTAVLADWYI